MIAGTLKYVVIFSDLNRGTDGSISPLYDHYAVVLAKRSEGVLVHLTRMGAQLDGDIRWIETKNVAEVSADDKYKIGCEIRDAHHSYWHAVRVAEEKRDAAIGRIRRGR